MAKEQEKRLFPRRPTTSVPVRLRHSAGPADELEGEVLDYAPSGLTVRVAQAVPAGTLLMVRPLREGNKQEIEIRVENCREQEGTWRLGCQFVETQHWDNLRLLG